MEVKVKLVVFKNRTRTDRKAYCSYCPATRYFFADGDTIAEVIDKFKQNSLLWELGYRNVSDNLLRRGWLISENSIIPPTFTDEEAISLTEKLNELQQLEDVQILEINVEVPKARTTWR